LLYFDRYTLDLSSTREEASDRMREAQERFIGELFNPGDSPDEQRNARRFRAEGHNRLASPLLALAYTMVALAALLAGEFNRRGQNRRILIAVGIVIGVQIASLGLVNLTTLVPMVAPLIYLLPVVTIAAATWVLMRPAATHGAAVAVPAGS
jgi:lipopolysaccharide export system permease protein